MTIGYVKPQSPRFNPLEYVLLASLVGLAGLGIASALRHAGII